MTEPIPPIPSPAPSVSLERTSHASLSGSAPQRAAFGDILGQALQDLNGMAQESDRLAEAFAAGEDIEIHEVMLAVQETQMAFELAAQVRNRVVDAYQEIMRMQV